MPCPYCDSSDWEVRWAIFHEILNNNELWQHQECLCRECGKLFVTKQLFVIDDTYYECVTMEEHNSEYANWSE